MTAASEHSAPSLLTAVDVEWRKLRRSLALVLAIVAPLLIALFQFFSVLRTEHAQTWDRWLLNAAAIWAFFMLPMSMTALAALMAHIEHGPRSWDHLRALPVPRWHLYAAKVIWLLLISAVMTAAVGVLSVLAVYLASLVAPALAPTGPMHLWHLLTLLARMQGAAMLLIAVQIWLSLRYASFVPALATGIAGAFFAVVATSARVGVLLPWQMPVNVLATDPARAHLAWLLGSIGGAVALLALIIHLSRREVLN